MAIHGFMATLTIKIGAPVMTGMEVEVIPAIADEDEGEVGDEEEVGAMTEMATVSAAPLTLAGTDEGGDRSGNGIVYDMDSRASEQMLIFQASSIIICNLLNKSLVNCHDWRPLTIRSSNASIRSWRASMAPSRLAHIADSVPCGPPTPAPSSS
jgi:hypothetical protein